VYIYTEVIPKLKPGFRFFGPPGIMTTTYIVILLLDSTQRIQTSDS